MTKTVLTVALLAGAFALSACSHLPDTRNANPSASKDDQEAVSRFVTNLDSLRSAARIPGLAVVVLRGTNIILARGFGHADVENAVPVTEETPFNIASVAKPVSAVVALRLAERGLLDLDRQMAGFSGFTDFCAGVRKSGGIFFRDYECDRYPLTLRHVLSMTANGVPGTRFFYNPPSFSWASRPMAEVSGSAFSALVAAEVFIPAGMTTSARIHRQLPLSAILASQLAKPYRIDTAGCAVSAAAPPPQGDGAAGGVIASAMELARFDIALTQGRLLSPASQKQMWSASRTASGALLPYGLGWYVQEFDGEPLLWHSGLWDDAYSALYLKVPNRRLTLILLANSDGLKWDNKLDEAAVERSAFAAAFLAAFPK